MPFPIYYRVDVSGVRFTKGYPSATAWAIWGSIPFQCVICSGIRLCPRRIWLFPIRWKILACYPAEMVWYNGRLDFFNHHTGFLAR